jgi:1,4-dihydroxy-2-naphthoyl-CoA hydrolase
MAQSTRNGDSPITPQQLTVLTSGLFEGHLGLEFCEIDADRVRARLTITPALRQATGITHGGVYCSIVESVASYAATNSLKGSGYAVGVSNHTDFLRPSSEGLLISEAIPIFRGRQQQLWRVMITDGAGRECAQGQLRLQNVFFEPS